MSLRIPFFLAGLNRLHQFRNRKATVVTSNQPALERPVGTRNMAELYRSVRDFLRKRRYRFPSGVDVLYLAVTEINLRETIFVDNIMRLNLPAYRAHWVSNTAKVSGGFGLASDFILLLRVLPSLLWWVRRNDCAEKYPIQYLSYFVLYYRCFKSMRVPPKLVVVANDHTPEAIGFSYAAKQLGIPRMYVQHAAVSLIFPELDFDAAVLMDLRSLGVYREIGELPINTFVVPRGRFRSHGGAPRPLSEPTNVGIYLGLPERTNIEALNTAVGKLLSNPLVSSVALSWHPRSDVQLIPEIIGTQVFEGIWKSQHIALVGNSSVSFDLLESRVPQLKLFELDLIENDYHRLVRDGVVSEVHLADLSGRLLPLVGPAGQLIEGRDDQEHLIRWISQTLTSHRSQAQSN